MAKGLRRFKSRPQAMPLFVDAWLGSQSINLMTPEEEGAYVRLLAHAWRSDTCTLPADDVSLAVLSRLGERWNTCSASIRKCFTVCDRDATRIVNDKQYELRQKQEAFWQSRQSAGISSGAARRYKRKRVEHVLNIRSDAKQLPVGTHGGTSSSFKLQASSEDPSPSSSSSPRTSHRPNPHVAKDGGEGGGSIDPGRVRRRTKVSIEDLRDDRRLEICYRRAVRAGVIGQSQAEREHYWSAAVHALAHDPVGAPNLFCWMVKAKEWEKISEPEGDEGHRRLKRWEESR